MKKKLRIPGVAFLVVVIAYFGYANYLAYDVSPAFRCVRWESGVKQIFPAEEYSLRGTGVGISGKPRPKISVTLRS